MKWFLVGMGTLLVLIVAVLAIGFATPSSHRAAVRVVLRASPDSVFARIVDVERTAEWRGDLAGVEVLSEPDEPLRWRETAEWGVLIFEHEELVPPRRIVSRIVDEGLGFGGTWTYQLKPASTGTELTIVEDGFIDNPIYRFMSRWVMGYHESVESYARDLGRSFGEDVVPERVR